MKRDQFEGLKHNVKLDVRLPDQLKDEFLARCRNEGVSSGTVLRSMIVDYVAAQPRRSPAMAASLKETLMKRLNWITSVLGGGAVTALAAMSLVFAPSASAEGRLGFVIVLRDGVGQIVSQGATEIGAAQADGLPLISGQLGENVRYSLQARNCSGTSSPSCPAGGIHVVLNLWDGTERETAIDRRIAVREDGDTLFVTELKDGRRLSLLASRQAET